MRSREEKILKFAHSNIPVQKNIHILRRWLEEKFSLVQISLSVDEFSEAFISMVKFNILHADTNERSHLSADECEIVVYRVEKNEKSKAYYDSISFDNNSPSFIYLILEMKSGYIFTNHGKLQLEIVIEQGYSKDDRDKENNTFLNYIACADMLENGEY